MNDTLKKIVTAFLFISIATGFGIVLKGGNPGAEPKGLELRWEIMLDNDVLECRESGGIVFFSDGSCIYAVDAKIGAEIWNAKNTCPDIDVGNGLVYGMDSEPAVSGGLVYCGYSGGVIRAFNAYTGKKEWEFCTNEKETFCRPVVYEGYVYCGTDKGGLYAIDARTGREKAMLKIKGEGIISLVIADGFIYFAGWRNKKRVGDYYRVFGVEIVR